MTTLSQPAADAGEVDVLVFGLERSRRTFAWKTGGLDAGALRRTFPPSAMTLGGLIKHVALVEDHYAALYVADEPIGAPWDAVDFDADPDWEWRTGAGDSPAYLYGLWDSAVERSRQRWAAAIAAGGLDRPAHRDEQNLRRVLMDLHEEYARHTGHADLMREAIDGLTGEAAPH